MGLAAGSESTSLNVISTISQEFLYENGQVILHKLGRLSLAVGKARV